MRRQSSAVGPLGYRGLTWMTQNYRHRCLPGGPARDWTGRTADCQVCSSRPAPHSWLWVLPTGAPRSCSAAPCTLRHIVLPPCCFASLSLPLSLPLSSPPPPTHLSFSLVAEILLSSTTHDELRNCIGADISWQLLVLGETLLTAFLAFSRGSHRPSFVSCCSSRP